MEYGPAISPITGSQKLDRESKNGGSRRREPIGEAELTDRRDSPPGLDPGVSLKRCHESTANVSQEGKAGPDPRGLHATAGLLREIKGELAVLKELKETVEDRLERIDMSLELLHSRIQAGPRERCSSCKAKLVGRREPYPGGYCWECHRFRMDRKGRSEALDVQRGVLKTLARVGARALPREENGMPSRDDR